MKNIKSIILTISISIMILSCSKDESNDNLPIANLKKEYQKVGKMHNDGLDYIIANTNLEDFIKKSNHKNNRQNLIDSVAIAQHVVEKVNEFLADNVLTINNVNIDIPNIENVNNFFDIYTNSDLGPYKEIPLTNKEETILQIDQIIDAINPDDADFSKTLSTGELYKFSLEFWDDFDESLILIDASSRLTHNRDVEFNWLAVAVSDAQGAWGGATLGPGGAVAFGLCGSAYNMCIQAMWQSI